MKVEEVMSTDLIVGYVPGNVKDALNILAKHNVSGMPILKKGTKTVVGVITRTDIFKNADEDQLALIMNEDFHFVEKGEDVEEAARLLYEHRIHGLPVLNSRQNIVGIISPTDIIKAFAEKKEDSIKGYYTHSAVPVYEETPINIVMEIINITRQNALPVINDELKLNGIVSDGDLFKLSHIREGISSSNMGIGDDEDQWTWEGIRDTVRLYHATTEVTLPQVPVKEVMVKDLVKAFSNSQVCDVAENMLKNDISHIPVVNADDRLIGMVTDIDLMKCIF